MPVKTTVKRTCGLWITITQGKTLTWYKVKFSVERHGNYKILLDKWDADRIQYTIVQTIEGQCRCSCPDFQKKKVDCKHISALKALSLIQS